MAQAPQPAGNGNFVRQIVSDPKNVPDVMLLYGYLGASSEEGSERLYVSPDLSNFVEVPRASILHRAETAKEQDPLGGVTLWVKKDAKVIYKMAPAQQAAQQALAYYFAGAIQAGAAAAVATPPIPPRTIGPPCPPQTIGATCAPLLCTRQATCRCTIDTCGCTMPPGACTQRTPCPGATCGVTCATCFTCNPAQCTQRSPCPGVSCGFDCTVRSCPPICTQASCLPNCTQPTPCLCTQRTPCPVVSCGIDCTVVACPTPVAPCPTPHATCAPLCTGAPCRPTFNQPDCPFPTEICTRVPAQCTRLPNCQLPQAAPAAMGGPVGAPATLAGTCNQFCVTTGDATCDPGCWPSFGTTCAQDCRVTLEDTCNYYVCVTNVGHTCYETCAACATLQRTCNVTCHPRWCFTVYDCPI